MINVKEETQGDLLLWHIVDPRIVDDALSGSFGGKYLRNASKVLKKMNGNKYGQYLLKCKLKVSVDKTKDCMRIILVPNIIVSDVQCSFSSETFSLTFKPSKLETN